MEHLFKKRQERLDYFKSLRNKIKVKVEDKQIPDNVLKHCPKCGLSITNEELNHNLNVCPNCNYHFRISAKERIELLVDKNSFKEFDKNLTTKNYDQFDGYLEKLTKAKKLSGLNEAIICGSATIDSYKVMIAAMDTNFMMGSMGSVVGEKLTRLIEKADKKKLPLIICCCSGGARMQEGNTSLIQMVKTSSALKRFDDHHGLYISLICDPTTGGVSASFASLGDIIIAEPNALFGFAGKRVIENTINEKLDDNFQSAEFNLEHGFVDMIIDRKYLKKSIADLIKLHRGK